MLAEVQENHETQEQVASMEAVLAAHRRRVYGVCRRRLGCEADAEDATQEVFRRYVEGVQTIRGDHGRWLVRCARNVCVDVVRSRRRRRLRERSRAAREGTSDEGMLVMETRELARFLLERLNPDDRELIRRHMMEGVPQKVLAAERGVSQQMVSRRVRDATGMMRRWVHEHVGTLSLGGLTTGFGAASSRAAVAVCTWLQRLPSPATWDLAVNKAVPAAGTIGLALMIPAATPPADNDTTPTGMGMASTGATWVAPFEPPAVGSSPEVQNLPGFHQSQAFGDIRVPTSQPRIALQAQPSQSNRSDGVPSRPPKIEPPATLIPASETDIFVQQTTPRPSRSATGPTPITVDASVRITPQRRPERDNQALDRRQPELSSPDGLIGRIELNSNEQNGFHPAQVAREVFKRKLA
ncbi:MAG: sigma-70 family RNA polymerase sigma factor, partial [Planctomycetota bacterium]